MNLHLDGETRRLEPVAAFRAVHGLPDDFAVAQFAPKDFTGLGRIDQAGGALNSVRSAVLTALPTAPLAPLAWQAVIPRLRDTFETALRAINDQVGLREPEIGFAVAGFSDVCEAALWARLRADATRTPALPFEAVYGGWLNDSARLDTTRHPYDYRGESWAVQVIYCAYGRIGLRVETRAGVGYLLDPALSCPAAGFMAQLLSAVCAPLLG